MRTIDLADRYRATDGDVLLTGVQALVRVLFDQLRADREAGLRTGAFVSGYQGSPLGTFDLTLARTGDLLSEYDVHLLPGVNEDIAATSVWGSQQDSIAPLARHDGVIGMWYGKGPGVDRSGDAFRHANLHGPGRNGGVIAAAGDDPAAKSSTLPHSTEVTLYDAGMPVLTPGTSQEVVDLGRHGYELSRFSGCWVGMRIVTSIADGFGQVQLDPHRVTPVRPELEFDGVPWRFKQLPMAFLPDSLLMETDLYEHRHPAALAYGRANGLNVVDVDPVDAWLTIVSPGRTYREVRQALAELGLRTDADLDRAGLRLLRLGMVYPLDAEIVRHAARGVEQVLVVEEKRAFVEHFVREALYGRGSHPAVTGKNDETEHRLVPADGELTAERLLPIVRGRLAERLSLPELPRQRTPLALVTPPSRRAAFCSGCPHNRSTVEASGSPVGGGVGCHAMVLWTDRGAVSYSQMGGEGAQWLGRAPFTDTPHWVQNVGDGTFFHSASLVVRAAVAAKARMTFKLLYNGTVAMTGGQHPEGQASIADVVDAMRAEGVSRITVVTDEPQRHRGWKRPPGVELHHRDALADVERALAAHDGVTMLVYDQGCAAELRRGRKRGTAPVRTKRVVINEAVCEGCGDCGVKSSCLSVHPVDTELGRKTQIDQTSCNTDYSCLDGDCPSFVTVESKPGRTRRRARADISAPAEPSTRVSVEAGIPFAMVAVGIGGTGVVTLNQIVATAAWAEGLRVRGLDQTGLSQKGGPVVSHLVLSTDDSAGSNAVGPGRADLYLALDPVAAVDQRFLGKLARDRTATVATTTIVPTIGMVVGEDAPVDTTSLLTTLAARSRPDGFAAVGAAGSAEAALGDASTANIVALGTAYQRGWLPLSADAIEAAIRANGVAVDDNVTAFRLGRRLATSAETETSARAGAFHHEPSPRAVDSAARIIGKAAVSAFVRRRAADLVDYQGVRLARRYVDLVTATAAAEQGVDKSSTQLTDAVAAAYFKLLAYKDEYEVARLHLLPEFRLAVDRALPEGSDLRYLLHPPVLRAMGMRRKLALPARVAEPTFRALRAMRRVRGTPLDVFGRTEMRRLERRLADDYDRDIRRLVAGLSGSDLAAAAAYAALPLEIRGYETVKLANIERYERERAALREGLLPGLAQAARRPISPRTGG
jgi:indolepyruvate ferredoxin oxidoreductase